MKASAMLQTLQPEPIPTTTKTEAVETATDRIRALNDAFRSGGIADAWALGRICLTAGVSAMSWADKFALMQRVKAFNDFSESNDAHGEHDFGVLEFNGTRYFWKIDYYDRSLKHGSPDPSDPAVTCRILTVMQASEY